MKIKFVNLNLWEGGILKKEISQFLQNEKPDIVTLQEVWQKPKTKEIINIKEFINGLNLKHVYFSPMFGTRRFGPKIIFGNAIVSKFPITLKEQTVFDIPYNDNYVAKVDGDWSDTPRILQHAKINANGTELNIFNVQGIWGFDGLDTKRRLAQGKIIADYVKGKKKVILAGDFNIQETSKTIGLIEKHLKNIFKNERKTSFNMKRKPKNSGYKEAIVDLVMITPDIKVISHTQPNVDISDHLPQVCEFEV
jgi:endonuclease/exonuclease/phosphatase family metal-dependent hydrolase